VYYIKYWSVCFSSSTSVPRGWRHNYTSGWGHCVRR